MNLSCTCIYVHAYAPKLCSHYVQIILFFIFSFNIHYRSPKHRTIVNYNFSCFIWVWNLVTQSKEKTQIEGVWEQRDKLNILSQEKERERVRGEWRKLHNENLHNLYFSPNFISAIKWNRMSCMEYVPYVGRWEILTKLQFESRREGAVWPRRKDNIK